MTKVKIVAGSHEADIHYFSNLCELETVPQLGWVLIFKGCRLLVVRGIEQDIESGLIVIPCETSLEHLIALREFGWEYDEGVSCMDVFLFDNDRRVMEEKERLQKLKEARG